VMPTCRTAAPVASCKAGVSCRKSCACRDNWSSGLVPGAGLEPAWGCPQGILSSIPCLAHESLFDIMRETTTSYERAARPGCARRAPVVSCAGGQQGDNEGRSRLVVYRGLAFRAARPSS
jgi:hypothetical protein